MSETLREFVDSRGVRMRVDPEKGILRGVKILGLRSRNGRAYLPDALQRAAALYEGAKVNVNHARGNASGPRDYRDRIGAIRDVVARTDEGLFGDFHFNPKHALSEQLIWDAEHAPENVGFSHNVQARTVRRDGREVVEAILKVQSVDLVADPATTRGLFESAVAESEPCLPGLLDLAEDDLRRHRPELVASLSAELRDEVETLREENARLHAAETLHRRRAAMRRLLAEYRLPDPEADAEGSRVLVGPAFVESLLAAPDEAAMRRLVEERARLVEAAGAAPARGTAVAGRPLSRDQHQIDLLGPADTKSFVAAITH